MIFRDPGRGVWALAAAAVLASAACVGVQDLGDKTPRTDAGGAGTDAQPAASGGDAAADAGESRDAGADASGPFAPGLVDEMIAVMKKEWPEDEILSITITDKDWTVVVNKTSGLAEYRRVWTRVHSRQMTKDGPYCGDYEVSFIQPSLDGVTFRATEYNSVGASWPIACP